MTPVVSVQLKKKLSISLPLIGLFVGTEAYFNQDDLIWNRLQYLKSDIFGTYCRNKKKKNPRSKSDNEEECLGKVTTLFWQSKGFLR